MRFSLSRGRIAPSKRSSMAFRYSHRPLFPNLPSFQNLPWLGYILNGATLSASVTF